MSATIATNQEANATKEAVHAWLRSACTNILESILEAEAIVRCGAVFSREQYSKPGRCGHYLRCLATPWGDIKINMPRLLGGSLQAIKPRQRHVYDLAPALVHLLLSAQAWEATQILVSRCALVYGEQDWQLAIRNRLMRVASELRPAQPADDKTRDSLRLGLGDGTTIPLSVVTRNDELISCKIEC